jgi:hypothetical protein
MIRCAGAALACAALLWPAVAAAQPVQRCESPDGKVTYSNTACPPGSQAVRNIQAEPEPSPVDQKAARERTQRHLRAVEQLERTRRKEEEKAERQRAAAQARNEKLAAECRRLEARVQAARSAFEATTLARRQEADRRLRLAQEQYDLRCRAP